MQIRLIKVLFLFRERLLTVITRTFIFLLCANVFSFTPLPDVLVTPSVLASMPDVYTNNNVLLHNANKINVNTDRTATTVSQPLTISGQVVDKNEMPMPDVTVYVTNIKPEEDFVNSDFVVRGTTTDFDGNFSLVAEAGYYLVISMVGYEFYTEKLTVDKTEYNITLVEKVSALDEILVVGYGTTVKKDLTGSVGSVKSEDIQQIKSQTIDQALVGKISGVYVNSGGGAPGSGNIVHIRGLSQLSGDNQPLYVIDGIPITINPSFSADGMGISVFGDRENPLLAINPDDVERIDVLKDASSAAIYGSRAANGVILITTKRGKQNRAPQFNFSYSATIQNPTDKLNYLNAEQYKTFAKDWVAQAIKIYTVNSLPDNYKQIANDPDSYFGNANTDWQDKILNKNALWNQYYLSLSGGSEKTNYLVSATVNEQEGTIIGNKFSRYNFQTNIDSQLRNNIKIGSSVSYNYSVNKQSGLTGLINANFRPDLGVYDSVGNYTSVSLFNLNKINPLGNEAKITNNAISQNLIGSVYGELKIIDDLTFKSQLGIGLSNDKSRVFTPSFTFDALFPILNGKPGGASLNVQTTESTTMSFNNTLNYKTSISEDHNIDAVAGISWDNTYINLESQTYKGFPDDKILTNIKSANKVTSYDSDATELGLNSLFVRVNYNYKYRYLLTLTGRSDASVKFGPENKRGFFPSAGLAWNVHNEDFLNNGNKIISNLKLRASLGRTGVDNLPAFSYEPKYISLGNGDSVYNGVNGIAVPDVPNRAIKWETTDQLDLGVEFGLFDSRLNGEVVYFEKNTSGLILQVPIAAETGDSEWHTNIADVSNKGWEISLNGDVIRTKDFSWNSSFNISFIKNNVDALNGGSLLSSGIAEGKPIGFINGYVVDRIAQNQAEIDKLNAKSSSGTYFKQIALKPGDYIFKDISGPKGVPDGEITTDDLTNLGDISPDFYGGWNNSLIYKNFSLGFNFQFVEGSVKAFTQIAGLRVPRVSNNQLDFVLDTWTPENTGATYARIGSSTHSPISRETSKSVSDASYIRLRAVSLAYRLPNNKIISKIGLDGASISISGNNLFTISDYLGQDPENVSARRRGGQTTELIRDEGYSYPQTRTFTFKINLSF